MSNIGTHWIAIFVKSDLGTYLDSFGIEQILKEIQKFMGNKDIIRNIFNRSVIEQCVDTSVLDLLIL